MKSKNLQKAQTMIELAVFGAVVIFLVGLIVKTMLNSSYQQDTRLKAFRMAMLTSFLYSEGLVGVPGGWDTGTASRNSASVFVLEDRLNAQSGMYGAVDRTPQIATGSASHTRNLFMPLDMDEHANLPVTDFFINGVHFPLTVAGFKSVRRTGENMVVFEQKINHPGTEWCNCAAGGAPDVTACKDDLTAFGLGLHLRFDLDRNGSLDDGVTDANCKKFMWQWKAFNARVISVENSVGLSADVDDDKLVEKVLRIGQSWIDVLDYQEGDISFSPDPTRLTPGLTNDLQMMTYTYYTDANGKQNTHLIVDEGKLYKSFGDTRRYVRSYQKKDSIDIIQRKLQLSKDTERFCKGPGAPVQPGSPEGNRAGWTNDQKNPVEWCCADKPCCMEDDHAEQVCMVLGAPGSKDPFIFVRSRIKDVHGRKWITPTGQDPKLKYLR